MVLPGASLSTGQATTPAPAAAKGTRPLNAAGIVGGYFENGTSTYKPYNTLTRGAMSAIVWRMEQYG